MQAIEHAIQTSGQANKRALARKLLIEKRKEEQERLLLEQEREQEEQRMIQLRISEEAEEKRRKADMYAQMFCSPERRPLNLGVICLQGWHVVCVEC